MHRPRKKRGKRIFKHCTCPHLAPILRTQGLELLRLVWKIVHVRVSLKEVISISIALRRGTIFEPSPRSAFSPSPTAFVLLLVVFLRSNCSLTPPFLALFFFFPYLHRIYVRLCFSQSYNSMFSSLLLVQNSEGLHGLRCLACGQSSDTLENLRSMHPKKSITGHEIAVELKTGEMRCMSCHDYVYCLEVDAIATSMADLSGFGGAPETGEDRKVQSIKNRIIREHSGTERNISQLNHAAGIPFMIPVKSDRYPPGLRGLNNMGHTCFMNAVLQAILHSPLMKEICLQGRHLHNLCEISLNGGTCIACELTEIFSAAYSGDREPYSPSEFLNAWWTLAGGVLGGGCKQQDAHEFFLFMLEMLSVGNGEDISQRVFGGTMRSDVICSNCGTTSSTLDKFTHVSLDVQPWGHLLAPPILPRARPHGNRRDSTFGESERRGKTGKKRSVEALSIRNACETTLDVQNSSLCVNSGRITDPTAALVTGGERFGDEAHEPLIRSVAQVRTLEVPNAKKEDNVARNSAHPALRSYSKWPGISLLGCLRQYVWPEELAREECPTCPGCGVPAGAVKRLSFVHLPPVIVFHAKRFEHTGGVRNAARKLDTFISFPLENLDMSTFLASSAMSESRQHAKLCGLQIEEEDIQNVFQELFLGTNCNFGADDLSGKIRQVFVRDAQEASPGTAPQWVPDAQGSRISEELGPQRRAIAMKTEEKPTQEDKWVAFNHKEAKSEPLYDLYAVICHSGTFAGGHYITYVRCPDDKWYVCDDALIMPVNEDAVKNCQAYMLFYVEKDIFDHSKCSYLGYT